jgi:hypothetical protein
MTGATDVEGCIADDCVKLTSARPGIQSDQQADPVALYGVFRTLEAGSRVAIHIVVRGESPVDVTGSGIVKVDSNAGCQDQPVVAVRYDTSSGTLSEISTRP